MKRMIVSSSTDNGCGGKVLETISYGNIKVVLESYWHSFLQKRIVAYAGSQVIGRILHVDCDFMTLSNFWEELTLFIDSFDTSGGEAGYYKHLNDWDKVKKGVVELLDKWKDRLSTGEYDPVSGERIDN